VESEYSWEVSATTIPLNSPPVVEAGPDQQAGEGVPVTFAGSFNDPDVGDTHTISWDFGDGDSAAGTLTPMHPYAEDGVYTVTLTVTDNSGEFGSDSMTATVFNQAPIVDPITAPLDPVQVGTPIGAGASFADPGILDTHTALWDWGDSTTTTGIVAGAGGSGSVTGDHVYTAPGVYTVALTVCDDDGGSGEEIYQYVVVYDPDGGFVTGGGWIDSPAGAFAADPSLTGKANFGFVSKYQKGATVPTGETEFRFKAADLDFHSTSYQWLVVAGGKALYKGDGQIDGEGNYGFMLSAIDGALPGGGGIDKFRIKIWDKATGTAVYDNQMEADDDADPTTVIGGGSIVIHK
jgi:PKD repeat protein